MIIMSSCQFIMSSEHKARNQIKNKRSNPLHFFEQGSAQASKEIYKHTNKVDDSSSRMHFNLCFDWQCIVNQESSFGVKNFLT